MYQFKTIVVYNEDILSTAKISCDSEKGRRGMDDIISLAIGL